MPVSTTSSPSPSTTTGARTEIFLPNKFWVEINGVMEMFFMELTGMVATTETIKVIEGGNNAFQHQLPKRTTFSNLTLKRGFSMGTSFWDWYKSTIQGQIVRKDLGIIVYSGELPSSAKRRWTVYNAYPVKWTGPTFNAKSNEFTTEAIELAYDWFTIAS